MDKLDDEKNCRWIKICKEFDPIEQAKFEKKTMFLTFQST